MNRKLTFVFVHGLLGWGSYDDAYKRTLYWGMRSRDLLLFLRGGKDIAVELSVQSKENGQKYALEGVN